MGTRKVSTSQLSSKMVAAEDVYTFNDQLIIQKGTPLTERIITRLKFYAINAIRVTSPELEDEPEEEVSAPIPQNLPYRAQVQATPEFKKFTNDYSVSVDMLSTSLDDIAMGRAAPFQASLLDVVSSSLSNVRNNLHLFDMLGAMHELSDIVYAHSLNVALVTHALGIWLNMSGNDLEVLTTAALLHDVGKLLVPSEILNKPSALSPQEYAIVKTHAQFGYNILKDQVQLDNRIKRAVLMHHERCDGSGYPVGLQGNAIDEFAKIIAIADVYVAMSSKRVYREAVCPFEIIGMFERDGLQKYDPHYVMVFRQGIAETYLHNNVKLSNGKTGEVVLINKLDLARPVVKISDSEYINLATQRDVRIIAVI